jgi:dTDP-4-dehydrorhamnose 3,5-epimerase
MTQPLDITQPRTPGVQLLRPFHSVDHRGDFCKFFDIDVQRTSGLANQIEECFVTTSHDRVLRGMHLQLPPHDHAKFVTCTQGRVLDVVLDLRVDSPRFGMAEGFELDGASPRTVAIPSGLAHGFCVLSGPATLIYAVTRRHAPSHDTGIRWDSFGFEWPVSAPLVSARDAALPRLADFASPFRMEPRCA